MDPVQPPGQLPHRVLPGDPLHIEQGNPCAAAAAQAALGELQGGSVQPLPHQGGVHPQGLGEGILAALQGFFQAGLCHRPALGAAGLKAESAAQLLKEHQAAAPAEGLRGGVQIRDALRGAAVDEPRKAALQGLLLTAEAAGAEQLRQRAQDLQTQGVSGHHPVQPADGEQQPLLQTAADEPLRIIGAAGKQGAQGLRRGQSRLRFVHTP